MSLLEDHMVVDGNLWNLLYLLLIFISIDSNFGMILVNLDSKHSKDISSPIKTVKYCRGCPSPQNEGSIGIFKTFWRILDFGLVYGLEPKHGVKHYFITGGRRMQIIDIPSNFM